MEKFLFIGGSKDGQWIAPPNPTPHLISAPLPPELQPPNYRVERYEKTVITDEQHDLIYYRHHSLTQYEALQLLFANYRPIA